ncbi:MAG: hypothetical protein PHC64_07730 [Candidatus Gastranaerophilales bacterium]|nr:hypothetical protein [Candidatus Gastranaerophilales bacterium]
MKVVNNLYQTGSFIGNTKDSDKNPISKTGERANLLKATAITGLGVGAKSLVYIIEDGWIFEHFWDWSEKLGKKDKKAWAHLGAFGAVVAGFIAGVAALYTIYKTPDIMYKGNINAFVKGNDMDVYIKGNEVEKELYNQMNAKAKNATDEEKQAISQQYLKLKAAKNQVPDSVQTKKNRSL